MKVIHLIKCHAKEATTLIYCLIRNSIMLHTLATKTQLKLRRKKASRNESLGATFKGPRE